MQLSEFDFELPAALIAQHPLEKRDESRMLAVNRRQDSYSDARFSDFPSHLEKGDVLVVNNTRVFPARLNGRTDTGARVEVFLVEQKEDRVWSVLAKPGRRLKIGKRIDIGERLKAEVLDREESGRTIIRFSFDGDFDVLVDELGSTPLPPYIKREHGDTDRDRDRYQTLYASQRGAIAAPTAGLHFTRDVLDEIKKRGVEIVEITLHVGYGTFEPVRTEDLSGHTVSPEAFEITEDAARSLSSAKSDGRRIIAVGTTSVRTLESAWREGNAFQSGRQSAELTIVPGYSFKAVDAVLTNFHLPKSSLLVLVSTFSGHDLMMKAYRHAVRERYRFYSYGDCMFVS